MYPSASQIWKLRRVLEEKGVKAAVTYLEEQSARSPSIEAVWKTITPCLHELLKDAAQSDQGRISAIQSLRMLADLIIADGNDGES